jgi:hypothetical protein
MSAYFGGALVSLPGRAVIELDQCPSCEACAFCGTAGNYGLGAWAKCLGWALEGRGWSIRSARLKARARRSFPARAFLATGPGWTLRATFTFTLRCSMTCSPLPHSRHW